MRTRIRLFAFIAAFALALGVATSPLMRAVRAQTSSEKNLRPDLRRALKSRQRPTDTPARRSAYMPRRSRKSAPVSARSSSTRAGGDATQGGSARTRASRFRQGHARERGDSHAL